MHNKLRLLFLLLIIQLLVFCDRSDNLKIVPGKDNYIAIDIGHSRNHPGAYSSRGVGEYEFNLRVAKRLLTELTQNGYSKSFMINENGNEISLRERTKIAENKKASILLSIHHDSVQPQYLVEWTYKGKIKKYCDKFNGYSIFVSTLNPYFSDSYKLGLLIGKSLQSKQIKPTFHHAEKIKGENRKLLDSAGVYQFDELAVLKFSSMPAILIECGIIVNRDEEKLLVQDDYVRTICSSIVSAIDNFYK